MIAWLQRTMARRRIPAPRRLREQSSNGHPFPLLPPGDHPGINITLAITRTRPEPTHGGVCRSRARAVPRPRIDVGLTLLCQVKRRPMRVV